MQSTTRKPQQARSAESYQLVLRSHTDPSLKARLEKLNQTNLPRIARNILKRTKIDHAHPERAIRFALLAVRSICREVVLFHEGWPGRQSPSALELSEELTRLFLTYLGVSAKAR